jgi:hypothetical protein
VHTVSGSQIKTVTTNKRNPAPTGGFGVQLSTLNVERFKHVQLVSDDAYSGPGAFTCVAAGGVLCTSTRGADTHMHVLGTLGGGHATRAGAGGLMDGQSTVQGGVHMSATTPTTSAVAARSAAGDVLSPAVSPPHQQSRVCPLCCRAAPACHCRRSAWVVTGELAGGASGSYYWSDNLLASTVNLDDYVLGRKTPPQIIEGQGDL